MKSTPIIFLLVLLNFIVAQDFTSKTTSKDGIATKIISGEIKNIDSQFTYENDFGDLEVTQSDDSSLKVEVIIQLEERSKDKNQIFDNYQINKKSKTTLSWEYDYNRNLNHRSVKVIHRIRIPKAIPFEIKNDLGNVLIKSINNKVKINMIAGNLNYRDVMNHQYAKTLGGNIRVENSKGDFNLSTSGGNIDLSNLDGKLDFKTSGGNISIYKVSKSVHAKTSGGSIDLKDIQGEVDVFTSGGNISLESLFGETQAETNGGSIELENINGKTTVETAGGNIDFRDVNTTLSAETASGRIKGKDSTGEIRLITKSGNIDLRKVDGQVYAETEVGNIEADINQSRLNKTRIELITLLGDVNIDIRNRDDLDIKLSTDRMSNSHKKVISNIEFNISNQIYTYVEGKQAHQIIISAKYGKITIKKK